MYLHKHIHTNLCTQILYAYVHTLLDTCIHTYIFHSGTEIVFKKSQNLSLLTKQYKIMLLEIFITIEPLTEFSKIELKC